MEKKESTLEKGKEGEEIAMRYLANKGYALRDKNWRWERAELDLVVETDTHIVFVEVKLRFTDHYGDPWEAVNYKKRRLLIKAADAYVLEHDIEKEGRFDIISVLRTGNQVSITHLEDAFWPMA